MSEPGALRESLDRLRERIDRALDASLPPKQAWPATLHRAVRYSLFAGGKRIRPVLVLASGESVGGHEPDLMPLACAVEMIHTYSLIHDDLPAMDDDDLRRGRPTSHKVFGEAGAILAGDALLTRAFHLLAEPPQAADETKLERRLRATQMLGEACGTTGLVGGQVVDLESTGRRIGPAELERMHRAKTGALLGACVKGGAVLGGASDDQLGQLTRYAEAIGLAFQVVDDVLDATESAESLGKTPGKDLDADKTTYVSVFGVETAKQMSRELLAQALAALEPLGRKADLLAGLARLIVERHG
jgi:geranylgeranyl diphosphate synthase type II